MTIEQSAAAGLIFSAIFVVAAYYVGHRASRDEDLPDATIDDLIAANAAATSSRRRFEGHDPELRERNERKRARAEKAAQKAAAIASTSLPAKRIRKPKADKDNVTQIRSRQRA